ncbi:SRPBCC family protein [Patescibacteria group bacterium]|nr:MAG: SRPBCC family protein [Patescibacteria group bacterium]
MKNYDVQSVFINAGFEKVFNYIADPANLPKWTRAFSYADSKKAVLSTPNGKLEVGLEIKISKELGVVDWHMTMSDGSIASAYSRITHNGKASVYTFVLMAPPGPIEQVEGTLKQQMELLREELQNLQKILGE